MGLRPDRRARPPRPERRPRAPPDLAGDGGPRRPGEGHEPAVPAPRVHDRRASLRHRQRPLSQDARRAHDLQLRLLAQRRHARRRPGGQAVPDRQQARARSRHAGARHRVWVGRRRPVLRREARLRNGRRHGVTRAGRAGAGALRRAPDRDSTSGLPRVERAVRSRVLDRNVRTRRRQELLDVHGRRAPLPSRPRRAVGPRTRSGGCGRAARPIRGSRNTSSPTRCCRRWPRSPAPPRGAW